MSPKRKESGNGSISDHPTTKATVQRDSEEFPKQSQSGKSEAEERYENNVEGGGQRSVDGDEENKSEKEEELESEKENDHQHDDNGSLMEHGLISTSQHDPIKTISIDRFQVAMSIDDPAELTGELVLTYVISGATDVISDVPDGTSIAIDYPSQANWCNRWTQWWSLKKELARATSIRRAVRQGQPSIKALHDQTTTTDLGASSGDVAGGVDVGSRHADATPSHDIEHCKDSQDKLFEKVEVIAKDVEELKSKRGFIPSKKVRESYIPTAAVRGKKRAISQVLSNRKSKKTATSPVQKVVEVQGPFKKVDIYAELGAKKKRDL
ncbi:hypothetical protein FXO37_18910 [Capsicum annuum]|nr:hypothetical protein FXO37_18910 [Capsicum annuum]